MIWCKNRLQMHYLSPKHSVACVMDILLQYILALHKHVGQVSSSTHLRVKIEIHSNTVNLNIELLTMI